MKDSKKILLVFILTIVAALWFFLMIYFKEEYIIVFTIFFGLVFLIGTLAYILEEIKPKNNFSKKLDKIIHWIFENINLP